MSKAVSPLLLEKYINNTCTEQEKQLVEAWYASLQGNNNYLESLPEEKQVFLQKETYQYIENKIRPSKNSGTGKNIFIWFAGIAASLLVLAGFYFKYKNDNLAAIASIKKVEQSVSDQVYFKNNEPRIVLHNLPDGTTVWMHSDASITYPKVFTGAQRNVTFKGEGFFDVAHDKKHPFILQSGELNIQVLGTRFNVKATSRQRIFEVAVVSGSVSVSARNQESVSQQVVLKPQQQAFFETISKKLTLSQIPVQLKKEIYEPVTISFEGTELKNVIEQLDKRFDTQIHLVNVGMSACRLTADFEQQPLPVILDMLCTSLDATYTMSEKVILIDGATCN